MAFKLFPIIFLFSFCSLCFLEALEFAPNEEAIYNEVQQLLSLNRAVRQDGNPAESADLSNSFEDPMDKPDVPRAVKNWPIEDLKLGQVSAVSINSALQPVIFHRAERTWDRYSFNETHHYMQTHLGTIKDDTVLTLDSQTGKVVERWGANTFYMPHGLTIDRHDNLWLTDVAMHQVFKFKRDYLHPILTFGKLFVPGSDAKHLCKPTSVAVATTGEIFIADGYCNSRILMHNAAGVLLRVLPNPREFLSLQVPHSLALIESTDRLCIADRENMRVVCPKAALTTPPTKKEQAKTIQQPDMGRLFAVAAKGKLIYAVNGFTNRILPIQGFTINPETETVIDHWAPEEGFANPHDIAVCPNGSALYVAEIGPNKIWKFELVPPK